MARRLKGKKATVAIAHSLIIIFHMLNCDGDYRDLGPDHLFDLDRKAVDRTAVRYLERLECSVILKPLSVARTFSPYAWALQRRALPAYALRALAHGRYFRVSCPRPDGRHEGRKSNDQGFQVSEATRQVLCRCCRVRLSRTHEL